MSQRSSREQDRITRIPSARRQPRGGPLGSLLPYFVSGLLAIAAMSCAGGVDAQPAETSASVKPGINKKYLSPSLDVESWIEKFEGESRQIFNQRQQISDALYLKPGMRVGDIGAGTGLFSRIFAHAVGKRGRVFSVEIAPAAGLPSA